MDTVLLDADKFAQFKDKLAITAIDPISKGWSGDKKYCIETADGMKFLLRVTPKAKVTNHAEMFRMQQEVAALGVSMCKPIEFGSCEEGNYIVQTWVEGKDAQDVIPYLGDSEQYAYGLEAGRILKVIHSIKAPANQVDWETRFNAKMDRKIKMYQDCPIRFEGAEYILEYIEENRHLLANRPQTFQHGDYHIGNMMIENSKLVIIDFDRYDYGDPWEEMNRIVWCAQSSPFFASGIVNGYFNHEVPIEFWKLLALYISSNMLSSIPWAIPYGEQEVNTMLNQAKDVLRWYDNMKNVIPTWYCKGLYLQYIDGLPYKMKSGYDFSFINHYGKVFQVFDDQDSGNICFGTEKDGQKYFVKYAGSPTERYNGKLKDAVEGLKSTLPIYRDLRHPCLVELIDAKEIGDGFVMIFKWASGDCMGRMYPAAHRRFMNLPIDARLSIFHDVLDFLVFINSQGYVAIDFYDGCIMYDYDNKKTTICDVDLFRRKPCINDMGRMWGSSKFMSPEEFDLGAKIDEVTNVYTAGAVAFALFGGYERTFDKWQLSEELYSIVTKATDTNRSERQSSIEELIKEWEGAIANLC